MSETSGPQIQVYPCDRGTGTPTGYHHYVSEGDAVFCRFCGQRSPRDVRARKDAR